MDFFKRLLTPEQVAEILRVHVLTVYNYIRSFGFVGHNSVLIIRNYK